MIEWSEQSARQALSAAGAIFEGKAFREPNVLTARLIGAMDYLINYHWYYHRRIK